MTQLTSALYIASINMSHGMKLFLIDKTETNQLNSFK